MQLTAEKISYPALRLSRVQGIIAAHIGAVAMIRFGRTIPHGIQLCQATEDPQGPHTLPIHLPTRVEENLRFTINPLHHTVGLSI